MKIFRLISVLFLFVLCSCTKEMTVVVSNPADFDRLIEMVELNLDDISTRLKLEDDENFVITGVNAEEIPYQITYDRKVIFPATLSKGVSESFKIKAGTPSVVPVKVCGNHYQEREDDIAWENDVIGFRVYGFKEDNPSGYDIFVKRDTDMPAVPEMYRKALDPQLKKMHKELKKIDKDSADRFKCDHMSFHVDHGYGADCYGVGPTLGAGVAAFIDEETILYPYCYESYRILDNGPLRFSLELMFRPFTIGECKNVTETRIITLDLGSHLNRTSVSYTNLTKAYPFVSGIVLQDKDGKAVGDASKGYIAYPAPTINYDKQRIVDNGSIFVGHVYPNKLTKVGITYFSDEESRKLRGNTKGHMLAYSNYIPGPSFIYYWGAGWDHSDMKSYEDWKAYLEKFSAQLREPMIVTLK